LDHGEETLSQCFRDSTSCSQQFARVGLRLFAKVVRQYRCSLPRSAWHDDNTCTRGEREAAAQTAQQLRELATAHGFVHWLDVTIVLPHTTSKALTVPTLAALHGELGASRIAVWRKVFSLCVFAQLCAEAGHAEEGLRALASIGKADRLAYLAPEVHRLEGELLLCYPAPRALDAERCFRTAIDIARARSEKSLELRATRSLSRLWNEQGKREEARRLLAEVYAWFTEGFDTLDLREAKALLDKLSSV
jgi:hypothetical protein